MFIPDFKTATGTVELDDDFCEVIYGIDLNLYSNPPDDYLKVQEIPQLEVSV